MKRGGVLLLALLCLAALTAGMAQGSVEYTAGPGAVQYALAQPDGARVSLTMVVVGGLNSAGVAVYEWWDRTISVAAIFSPPGSMKTGQTIDLEGWMTTLSDGRRAVLCERIAFYLDTYGSPLDAVPPMKGLLDPSVWPQKGWIPVSPAQSGMSSMSGGGIATVLDDPEPPIVGDPPPGGTLTCTTGTISWAKTQAEAVTLVGKIVTVSTGQIGANCIYIEEPDRSAGIRVNTNGMFAVGEVVSVSGTLTTADGERIIQASSVTSLGSVPPLKPCGYTNRDLGGGDFEYNPQTGAGQQAMYDPQYLDYKAHGLNNIGLLVKTWGKVTRVDSSGGYFYIDDGCELRDGTMTGAEENVGVRVVAGSGVVLPSVNDRVEITGISSCTMSGQSPIRVLRARSQADIRPSSVIYVRPGGPGDGSTWLLALSSIGTAIQSASFGQEIWVAGDELHPYNEHITLTEGIRLYGGFAGNENRRDQRDRVNNETVIDGGETGRVVSFATGVTQATILDGFTIRNGKSADGGGISCINASPTITCNVISQNTAYVDSGYAHGGGIYCSNASPLIANNIIRSNVVTVSDGVAQGGGIYCASCPSIRIINNTILGNTHPTYPIGMSQGGGIYATQCVPLVANNIIASNTSGIYTDLGVDRIVNNCVWNPPGYNYSDTAPDAAAGNISVDPLLDSNARLLTGTPCKDAGSNSTVEGDSDIDGEYRIQDGTVDIGADEALGCVQYKIALFASPNPAQVGTYVDLVAMVYDPLTRAGIRGITVSLSVDGGVLGDTSVASDHAGVAATTVRRDTMGRATVTASIPVCGNGVAEAVREVFYYDPNASADVFFVLDRSASMNGSEASYHFGVEPSVQRLIREISSLMPNARYGAAMFSSGTPNVCSISLFTGGDDAVDDFCEWIGDFFGYGQTSAQVLALQEAVDDLEIEMYSLPSNRRFVVYVTDVGIGTDDMDERLQLVQALDSVTAGTGGGVFISLWEDPDNQLLNGDYRLDYHPLYPALAVNGGFDSICNWIDQGTAPEPRYLFDNLRNRILYGL